MTATFSRFHPFHELSTASLAGSFTKAWSKDYNGNYPAGGGSGLRVKSVHLKPHAELPEDIRLLGDPQIKNFAHILTSTSYPILYVGVNNHSLRSGIFKAGRLGHHVRKLLAVHQNLQTNHTAGWRRHV